MCRLPKKDIHKLEGEDGEDLFSKFIERYKS
jgi:hypothetical protein